MQQLTIWDFVLTPVYLVLLIAIARRWRDKHYPHGNPLRKYVMPGLYAKFGGAIFIGLIYAFYYKGGDTFNFFFHAKVINSALNDSLSKWLLLILRTPTDRAPEIYPYASQMWWYNAPTDYSVGMISALLGLFTFTTYLPTALLFAFLSYTGIWAMYRTFTELYPKLVKPLAIAFLFIPSTVVWGSGIFKDTICMFGLGWMTFATFRLFVNRDFSIKNIFLLGISFYLIARIKLYILLGFIPALALWLLLTYSKRIKTVGLRWMITLLFLALASVSAVVILQRLSSSLNKYSLDRITQTAKITQGWITYASGEEGSTYDIGEIDGTLGGTLSLFPKAVAVTLFRPFPWEARKVIMAFSALEALIFIYFTLQVFFNRRVKTFRYLLKDPSVLFCFVFAVIFAFAVGASSGNFGALSRYKIPCLPFYGAFLMICMNYEKQNQPIKSNYPKRLKKTASFA